MTVGNLAILVRHRRRQFYANVHGSGGVKPSIYYVIWLLVIILGQTYNEKQQAGERGNNKWAVSGKKEFQKIFSGDKKFKERPDSK